MSKALDLAIRKAASLPEPVQEQLGRELLERIQALTELREALDVGVRELDAGLGEELDLATFIKQLRQEDDGGK